MKFLDKTFQLSQNKTSVKTELTAAVTTFVSLSYILFVNPNILHAAGIDKGAAFTVTALATAIGCFIMGLVANYPIALAPTLGSGAFFAYNVCVGMHVNWATALAAVLIASVLFIIITVLKLREKVVDAIPQDLKYAIAAGIGLFIAFIGLQNGKLIVNSPSSLVTLGKFNNPDVWITLFGLILTAILMAKKVPGSIFIGMVITAIFGVAIGRIPLPHQFVAAPPSVAPTFGKAIFHLKDINTVQLWMVVLTFLLVTFFDTAGMPLTYSISDGLALGMIAYPLTMLAAKRYDKVTPVMYVLLVVFVIFFLITNL